MVPDGPARPARLDPRCRAALVDVLASMLAKARCGSSVYMGGEHEPSPREVREAEFFVAEHIEPRLLGTAGDLCCTFCGAEVWIEISGVDGPVRILCRTCNAEWEATGRLRPTRGLGSGAL